MNRGIVLYDFLHCLGGAEQVTLDLARNIPKTDICVGFRNHELFPDEDLEGITCIELRRLVTEDFIIWRTWRGIRSFSKSMPWLRDYEWAVFSGSNAPAGVRNRRGLRNIYYCHTIPRFAYDLYEYYHAGLPFWQKPLFRAFAGHVRKVYEPAVREMNTIVVNSENVRKRLQSYLGLESQVIYPPCHVNEYAWKGQGDYYLSTARLQPYKRVDTIVKAFVRMPDKKLVVASGGSEETRLKRFAAGSSNILFSGWQSPERLKDLVGEAIATIYISRDEDFGMSPVESMAAGKPVIGVAEGGLLETVVPGETGLLIREEPDVEDVVDAVQEMTPSRAADMRRSCEERARLFSKEVFLSKMREVLER